MVLEDERVGAIDAAAVGKDVRLVLHGTRGFS